MDVRHWVAQHKPVPPPRALRNSAPRARIYIASTACMIRSLLLNGWARARCEVVHGETRKKERNSLMLATFRKSRSTLAGEDVFRIGDHRCLILEAFCAWVLVLYTHPLAACRRRRRALARLCLFLHYVYRWMKYYKSGTQDSVKILPSLQAIGENQDIACEMCSCTTQSPRASLSLKM